MITKDSKELEEILERHVPLQRTMESNHGPPMIIYKINYGLSNWKGCLPIAHLFVRLESRNLVLDTGILWIGKVAFFGTLCTNNIQYIL